MNAIDILRILILTFYLGETEGRMGCNAPPLQATECWISAPGQMAGALITVDGVRYTTEANRENP